MSNRINICIDHEVYAKLKDKGKFGESFSDLVSRILNELDMKSKSLEVINPNAYSLKNYNVIDFLSKYCKNEEHKNCHGNWVGLSFRVGCNCSCHHNNMLIDFSDSKNHDYLSILKQNNNSKTAADTLSSISNYSNQDKNDAFSEREEANLHFSLKSSTQERSQQHNIKTNGDPIYA